MCQTRRHRPNDRQPLGPQFVFFQPLALGNITQNRRPANRVSLWIAQLGNADLHRYAPSIPGQPDRFQMTVPVTGNLAFNALQFTHLENLGRHQHRERLADNLLGAPAKDTLGSPVPRADVVLRVEGENHIGGIIDDAFELLQMAVAVAGNVRIHRQGRVEHEHLFQRDDRFIPAIGIVCEKFANERDEQLEVDVVPQQVPTGAQPHALVRLSDAQAVLEIRVVKHAVRDAHEIIALEPFQPFDGRVIAQQLSRLGKRQQFFVEGIFNRHDVLFKQRTQRPERFRIAWRQPEKLQPLLSFRGRHCTPSLRTH